MAKMRDYLMNRAVSRNNMNRDYRNAYGSSGGYVRDYYNRDYRNNNDYRNQDYNYQYNGQPYKPMYDYNMNNDYNYDYKMEEEHYHEELEKWTQKLKQKDTRFGASKQQVLNQARNMQIKFNNYDEDEFYATYLMIISDFPKISNDYNMYINLAKEWLEDDDVKLKGGDKLCAYLYTIVLGKDD